MNALEVLLCSRKPLYTLSLVCFYLLILGLGQNGWCPENSLGDHCGPGHRSSWRLERTPHLWDHSSGPRPVPQLFILFEVASCCCFTLGLPWPHWPGWRLKSWVIVWLLEISRRGISHRTLATREGRSHSAGWGRLDLGPRSPATPFLCAWAVSILREQRGNLLSSWWPMGETLV